MAAEVAHAGASGLEESTSKRSRWNTPTLPASMEMPDTVAKNLPRGTDDGKRTWVSHGREKRSADAGET